jgi:hypothetical protein
LWLEDANKPEQYAQRDVGTAGVLAARLLARWWQRRGKSTVAGRIAADHRLKVYATDDVMSDHARRAPDEGAPYLSQFKSSDMDERWVKRSPETMLETFHWFRGEGST